MDRLAWPSMFVLVMSTYAPSSAAVDMIGPSIQPTRGECEAIRKHNEEIVRSITKVHQGCLDRPSQENFFNKPSSPCSKFECRDLHLRMDAASKAARDIGSECSRRASRREPIVIGSLAPEVPDPPRPSDDDSRKKAWNTFSSVDSAVSWAIDLNRVRKDPTYLIDMAWGKASEGARERIEQEMRRGSSPGSVESEAVRYLFDRSIGAMGEASRNPVARVVNEAMLNKLFLIHTQAQSELDGAFARFDREMSSGKDVDRRRPYGAPGALSVRDRESGRVVAIRDECTEFANRSRSDALRRSDPGRWLSLALSCSPK